MADPLLTSLCSICHISDPKYTCPRCSIRTCSLACIKKHKAWSSCSGVRDPTVYKAVKQLRTPAGVDHDYNFLHGIERKIQRSERELIEEKALVQKEELRPLTTTEVRWKAGRGGRMTKVVTTRVLKAAKERSFERHLANKLAKLNIQIVCAPTGMARQKENTTTLNRKTGRINWQVEWIRLGEEKKRSLSKVMDDVPLFKAYHGALEDESRQGGRFTRGRRYVTQNADSTWNTTVDAIQDALDGTWVAYDDISELWPSKKDAEQKRSYSYFLAGHGTPSDQPTVVSRLGTDECLRDILADGVVLEFPTIYVLRRGEVLPSSCRLGPKMANPTPGSKRKIESSEDKGLPGENASKKKRRLEDDQRADGEMQSGDEAGGALEAGEVIDEQSFDENEDDTSDTSSSGSSGEEDDV